MQAEILACMIFSEGPHTSVSPSWCCSASNRKVPNTFGASSIKEYVMHILLHKVFSGVLQVVISNGMVCVQASMGHCMSADVGIFGVYKGPHSDYLGV